MGFVGSSTRVKLDEATSSPRRLGEQAVSLEHRLARECAPENSEELSGHERIEHDGDPLGWRLLGAKQSSRPICRIGGRLRHIEFGRISADAETEADLRVIILGGQGGCRNVVDESREATRIPAVETIAASLMLST